MLSHALDADFSSLNATLYDERVKGDEIEVSGDVPELEGVTLIFDDIVDTGETMATVQDIVEEEAHSQSGRNIVRTASIHVKPDRSMTPDYWIEETDKWTVYPWEVDL